MPELVFLRRGEEVLRFALDRSRVVLGRGDHADVVIPDPEVSRQQAAVLLSEGGVVVEGDVEVAQSGPEPLVVRSGSRLVG